MKTRRKTNIIGLLLALCCVASYGTGAKARPVVDQCRVGATIKLPNGQPHSGIGITIYRVELNGQFYSYNKQVIARTNTSGVLISTVDNLPGFDLPQGARVWLYANWGGLSGLSRDPSTGTPYEVPMTATADLTDLYELTRVLRLKGDLPVAGQGGIAYRFPVSGNNGYVLQEDSSQTYGLKWGTLPLTTFGSQSANRVLASPDGSSGTLSVRALALGDIPTITNAKLQNSSVTIGSTSVSLGATAATIAGLTLTTPTIASFNNANHSHTDSIGGGQLTTSALTGLGTGVGTALGVNVGSAGAFVTNGGALGTPSSGVGSNLTALNASNISSGSLALARIAQGGATSNQVLAWNGSTWAPASAGGLSGLTSGNVPYADSPTSLAAGPITRVDASTVSANRWRMPKTTSSSVGVFQLGTTQFMHTWIDPELLNYNDIYGGASQNTFVGEGAGNFTTGPGTTGVSTFNGGRNSCFGYLACRDLTTANQITALGYISGLKITSGRYNTYVGAFTGVETTTGSNNTGIGADALWLTTSGDANTGVGSYTLQQNTTGHDNTGIGYNSLRYNQTSNEVTCMGSQCLENATSSTRVTAVGYKAGYGIISGARMAVFGALSAAGSTGADDLSAFGNTAGQNVTGARNSLFGSAAADDLTTGTDNTIMGSGAGGVLQTGSSNILVGSDAGANITTGSSNIIIGTNRNADSATGSNQLNIGGAIKGDLSTGYVGLGIAIPTSRLHIVENSNDQFRVGRDTSNYTTFTHSSGNTMTIAPGVSASSVLAVTSRQMDVGVAIPVNLGGSGNGYGAIGYNIAFTASANTYNYRLTDTAFGIMLGANGGNRMAFNVAASGTGGTAITFTEALSITTAGNVGIGAQTFGTNAAGVLGLQNATAPTTSPSNMVQVYSTSGELTVRDAAGNTTTLSPHNFTGLPRKSEPLAWSYNSSLDGVRISVDMLRVVRLLEQMSSEKLVFIRDEKTGEEISPAEYLKRFQN